MIFAGGSVRKAADELKPGLGRDIVKAVGGPAGWISDRLPFADARQDPTSWLSPNQQLSGRGFVAGPGGAGRPASPRADHPPAAHTLLVTGDSLSTPLDIEIARKLADQGAGVQVTRDPHLATGISNTGLVDWGKLSSTQASDDDPDAVVLFIGANEGYSMPGPNGAQVSCCGPAWEAIFRSRVGQMMDNYLDGGVQRIYWLTVPTQRDPARKPIADDVNQAIREAAAAHGPAVRVVDLVPTFTPGDSYRDRSTSTATRRSSGARRNPPERGRLVARGRPRPAGRRSRLRLLAATRPLHFGAKGEARSDLCGTAACGRDLMAKLGVLRVGALDPLGGVRGLVALGGRVVLHVRHAGTLAVLAGEAVHGVGAVSRRAAALVAAPVIGGDHLLALGAADALHLERGHVGGAELLLLPADVAGEKLEG